MSAQGNTRAMLGVILIGFASFLGLLYLLGSGEGGNVSGRGGNHAASAGLDGYRAMRKLAERQGYGVTLARDREALGQAALTVLTPPLNADGEELDDLIDRRRRDGPTIVILPKWVGMPAGEKPGWIRPYVPAAPTWIADVDAFDGLELVESEEPRRGWRGFGLQGDFPRDGEVISMRGGQWRSLVRDGEGRRLVAILDDGSAPFDLFESGALDGAAYDDDPDEWALMVISEPDLVNNWGFADPAEAQLAMKLLDVMASETEEPRIVFDITLNGLAAESNVLSLAFRPPFLAATLCLLLAAIALGWRGMARFGPALAEDREIAFGKSQLVANSAALVERTRRFHLLGAPYAALMRRKIARRLGIARRGADRELEREIDLRLLRRGRGDAAFTGPAAALRGSDKPADILRAARELKDLERTLL